jgi:hypothetical protein
MRSRILDLPVEDRKAGAEFGKLFLSSNVSSVERDGVWGNSRRHA